MGLLAKLSKMNSMGSDEIPEKIHKRLHIIYFFLKCVIGAMIFLVFYINLNTLIFDVPEMGSEESPFLMHQYCGTFFVEINRDNSFASPEAYSEYLEKYHDSGVKNAPPMGLIVAGIAVGVLILAALVVLQLLEKKPGFLDNRYVKTILLEVAFTLLLGDPGMAASIIMVLNLFLALRCGDKKTVFSKQASDYFLISGGIWLIGNLITAADACLHITGQGEGMVGVFSHPIYYFQIYRTAAIPLIILCGGLMLRYHELDLKHANISVMTRLFQGTGIATLIGSAGFLFYRLGVRIYELVKVMSGEEYTVKLPFTVMDNPYSQLIDLPYDMALSAKDYMNTVLFRFMKDFPVFVLSAAAVVLFVRVLFRLARGEMNTVKNRRYLNISMIVLVAASLWFNLMGIKELDFFNNGFTGIYGEVVYTPSFRSLTEPALYALALWFFKTYLQMMPETKTQTIPKTENE